MNKEQTTEIKDTLKEHIEELIGFVKEAGDFVLEQAPLVIQEILTFNAIKCIFWIITSLTVYLLSYKFVFKWSNQEPVEYSAFKESKWISIVAGGAASTIFTVVLCSYTLELFKITLAPRLYIIEYLSKLI